MTANAEEEKLVDMGRVTRAEEKKRIDIDVSRFKLPRELLEGGEVRKDNVGLFFETFMDSTFGSLGKPFGLINITEHDRPLIIPLGIHSAVGRYEIDGIELRLFYEKIGDFHTFSLHIRGKGEKELVESVVERAEKQKEIMEKTGRMYSVEDMTEIIEIDATKLVNKRHTTFDEKGYVKEHKDRRGFIPEIHGEFIEKVFGDYERERGRTGHGVLNEDYGSIIAGSNISTGWDVKDLHINLVSRVGLKGTWVVHSLHVIITNKYPDNEEIFKIACERTRIMKGIIEATGMMEVPKKLEHKYPGYNLQRLLPPHKHFGGEFRTRVAKKGPSKGKNGLKR